MTVQRHFKKQNFINVFVCTNILYWKIKMCQWTNHSSKGRLIYSNKNMVYFFCFAHSTLYSILTFGCWYLMLLLVSWFIVFETLTWYSLNVRNVWNYWQPGTQLHSIMFLIVHRLIDSFVRVDWKSRQAHTHTPKKANHVNCNWF